MKAFNVTERALLTLGVSTFKPDGERRSDENIYADVYGVLSKIPNFDSRDYWAQVLYAKDFKELERP